MERFFRVCNLFPQEMRDALLDGMERMNIEPEEIRIRIGSPMRLRTYQKEVLCGAPVTKAQMIHLVGNAAEGSFHTAVRHMQNGYIPLKNGGRMGVCGSGVDGKLSSFADVSSACIRIASEAIGCADMLYDELYGNGYVNTIIVAPPGAGKTTLLREMIRKLSYSGNYVGVADERGEIAGMYRDRPSFDLGPRCDVLTEIPKSQAAMMLLRSMSPNVIAMDEITAIHDAEAILEAAGCGSGLLTTIHGDGMQTLRKPAFRQLYDAMVFEKAIFVEVIDGNREYRVIKLYDEDMWSDTDYRGRRFAGVDSFDGIKEKNSFADAV